MQKWDRNTHTHTQYFLILHNGFSVYWWRSMNGRGYVHINLSERVCVCVYVWKYYKLINCIHSNRMRIFILFIYLSICGACFCVSMYVALCISVSCMWVCMLFSSSVFVLGCFWNHWTECVESFDFVHFYLNIEHIEKKEEKIITIIGFRIGDFFSENFTFWSTKTEYTVSRVVCALWIKFIYIVYIPPDFAYFTFFFVEIFSVCDFYFSYSLSFQWSVKSYVYNPSWRRRRRIKCQFLAFENQMCSEKQNSSCVINKPRNKNWTKESTNKYWKVKLKKASEKARKSEWVCVRASERERGSKKSATSLFMVGVKVNK